MLRVRRLEAEHRLAQVRRSQPIGNLAAQHALVFGRAAHPLSGDHEDDARALGARGPQKPQQRAVSLGLREAVQIDVSIDPGTTASKPLPKPAIETGQGWN